MFKQMLQGFQRKTVPFTIVVGLFLLTFSFYEAIWQTPAAHFVTYCVPALLFVAFATGVWMYSFVSYEYRLLHNNLFVRLNILGKPVRAIEVQLDQGTCRLDENYHWRRYMGVRKSLCYLPLLPGHRRCLLTYQEDGVERRLVFRPCDELLALIHEYIDGKEERDGQ